MAEKNPTTELSLSEKLSRIQVELKAPKDKLNKFGGYNYRSAEGILEALKPLLYKYGAYVTLTDEVTYIANRVYVKTTASIHDIYSEKSIVSCAYAREAETKKGMDEAQVTGATSSYARKYALNGLFLLDDNKDADTDEYATESRTEANKPIPTPKASAVLICERCGNPIAPIGKHSSADVANQTRTKFGKQMCYECGKAVKAEREKPTESLVTDELSGLPFPMPED